MKSIDALTEVIARYGIDAKIRTHNDRCCIYDSHGVMVGSGTTWEEALEDCKNEPVRLVPRYVK